MFVKELLSKLKDINLTNRFYKEVKKDVELAAGSSEGAKEIAGLILTNLMSKNLEIDCKFYF